MATERKRRIRETDKRNNASFHVLAVQCVVCVVLVLVTWLFARFGGSAAVQLRTYLQNMLQDNSIATAVSLWVQQSNEEPDTKTEESQSTDEPTNMLANTTFVTAKVVRLSGLPVANTDAQATLPIAPDQGTVTSLFGQRENPTATGDEFHKGLDIAAESGTKVSAMLFGVVTDTGVDPWLGNYVVLSHGDIEITYAHCRDVSVAAGTVVKAGDRVATVGSTGNSTGNHLHIEMRKAGELCDPAVLVPVSAYD